MAEYRVVWRIDILAASPQEAAAEALRIQRDPKSIATMFEVYTRAPGPGLSYSAVERIDPAEEP